MEKLIITSERIAFDNQAGTIKVACNNCGRMYPLEVRQMSSNASYRNQPWCSRCRAKAAKATKQAKSASSGK